MTDRTFIVSANDAVKEIDDDGGTFTYGDASGLFADLLFAGYPLMHDDCTALDGTIDLRTDGTKVIVHTSGAAPREHDMGEAAEVFLDWYRAACAE